MSKILDKLFSQYREDKWLPSDKRDDAPRAEPAEGTVDRGRWLFEQQHPKKGN